MLNTPPCHRQSGPSPTLPLRAVRKVHFASKFTRYIDLFYSLVLTGLFSLRLCLN